MSSYILAKALKISSSRWLIGAFASIVGLVLSSQCVFAFEIKGRLVYAPEPALTHKIPIVLLKVELGEAGAEKLLGFAQGSQTDDEGQFVFSGVPFGKALGYRIGISFQGQRLASATLKPQGKDLEYTFDIEKVLQANRPQALAFSLRGKLTFTEQAYFQPTEVVLIQHQMNENQVVTTKELSSAKVDAKGYYDFGLVKADPASVFKIGTLFHGDWLLSKLFAIRQGELRVENFTLPPLREDKNELEVSRISLLASLNDKNLTFTELINIHNPTEVLLELKGKAKTYPPSVENLSLSAISQASMEINGHEAVLKGFFPPGDKLELIEFTMPRPLLGLNLTFPLFLGTQSFDVILPTGGLTAHLSPSESHTEQTTMENNQVFTVTSLDATSLNGIKQVSINFANFPIAQKIYWWVGGIMAVFLFFPFFVFLYRMRRQTFFPMSDRLQ